MPMTLRSSPSQLVAGATTSPWSMCLSATGTTTSVWSASDTRHGAVGPFTAGNVSAGSAAGRYRRVNFVTTVADDPTLQALAGLSDFLSRPSVRETFRHPSPFRRSLGDFFRLLDRGNTKSKTDLESIESTHTLAKAPTMSTPTSVRRLAAQENKKYNELLLKHRLVTLELEFERERAERFQEQARFWNSLYTNLMKAVSTAFTIAHKK
ncbi:hypothetical protein K438DRAFT_1760590 [Mycena galopus ATCC 62051]|nr:hypothetical protein K438DRAFT_1760590 [Mycena galopus ATCC 62051]